MNHTMYMMDVRWHEGHDIDFHSYDNKLLAEISGCEGGRFVSF